MSSERTSRHHIRRRALVKVITGSVLLAGAGAAAGTFLKSPQQVAAETAPPPAKQLTASVEKKVLAQSLITRGTVAPEGKITVQASTPTMSGKTVRSVYTKVNVTEGQAVKAGSVLFEVSGRPVIALNGVVPAYRNLTEGDTGDDVAEFQHALATLGYGVGGDQLGHFGPGTSVAVSLLYSQRGYSVPTTAALSHKALTDGPTGASGGRRQNTERGNNVGIRTPLVPAAEIVYIPHFPAHAEKITAKVGADTAEEAMQISTGSLIVTGQMSARERRRTKNGQQVVITSSRTGDEVRGVVSGVARQPTRETKDQTSAGAGEHFAVTVKPSEKLGAEWSGQSVRLTIEATSTDQAVLAVPSAAISSSADGHTTVTVKRDDGRLRHVAVSVGMSADGFVQITPEHKDALERGDLIVVGTQRRRNT